MPNTPLPYTLTNDTLTVVIGGRTYSVRRGSEKFDAACQAVAEGRWDDVPSFLSPGLAIERWLSNGFTVNDGFLAYNGDRIDQSLNTRLMKMADAGTDPSCWLKFWARLQANPSYRSVNQLYGFLTHENIAIDEEDGFILAYKSVRSDYKDHHSGTCDNHPGVTNEMPRNKISDDPDVACHYGYHIGHISYARDFGGDGGKRIVICKVDPADVVCVPKDCSQKKVRVCKYTVIGNYSGQDLPSTTFRDDTKAPVQKPIKAVAAAPVKKKGNVAPAKKVKEEKPAAPAVDQSVLWAAFDRMDESSLLKEVLGNLRTYAALNLKIVGASKLVGGKEALVKRIIEVRR